MGQGPLTHSRVLLEQGLCTAPPLPQQSLSKQQSAHVEESLQQGLHIAEYPGRGFCPAPHS